jgi:ATP-dependent Clp protease, protease subunit
MPLVPSVTELVIAQLLYLNYQSDQLITLYINSPGTNSPDGRAFSFDTEAFAIADTMLFIKPPIRTICVGQAYGTAAMLLSLGILIYCIICKFILRFISCPYPMNIYNYIYKGNKGNRMALPNASIMLNQPRSRARGQASDVVIKAKEVIHSYVLIFMDIICNVIYIYIYLFIYLFIYLYRLSTTVAQRTTSLHGPVERTWTLWRRTLRG